MLGFDKEELIECIQQSVKLGQDGVPPSTCAGLYLHPAPVRTEPCLGVKKPTKATIFVTLSRWDLTSRGKPHIQCPCGPIRSHESLGGNCGLSLSARCDAVEKGRRQVLWLCGEANQVPEAGTTNLFLCWINADGELATPPLGGIVLPGGTRQSLLDPAHSGVSFRCRRGGSSPRCLDGSAGAEPSAGEVWLCHRLHCLPGFPSLDKDETPHSIRGERI